MARSCCDLNIGITDSTCIDLTLTGAGTPSNPYNITADAVISALPNNIVTCVADGLFAEEAVLVVSTNGDTLGVSQSGTADHIVDITLVSGDVGQIISVGTDGGVFLECADLLTCLDVTTDGTPTGVTEGPTGWDITITDTTGDNLIIPGPNGGAYLTCEAVQDCVGLAAGDSLVYNDVTDTIDLCLSTDANNAASLGTDNCLYVPAIGFQVSDTSCVDITLSGTGTIADPYVVSADPIVSPDSCNRVECRANGLFVSAPTEFELGFCCEASVGLEAWRPIAAAQTIDSVYWNIATAPTGSDLLFDIQVNGATQQTVTVAATTTSGSVTGLSIPVVAGDLVSLEVTQIGSTTPGDDLTAVLGACFD